ncbi:MAG TPA: hypothetical protein PLW97_06970, partial [Synergistaceae bacterium]|nr:hypothetical protein [Synergistaceae bacterium]
MPQIMRGSEDVKLIETRPLAYDFPGTESYQKKRFFQQLLRERDPWICIMEERCLCFVEAPGW